MNNYNTEKEIWKDIVGYEGYYQISNFGRVKSITRKVAHERGHLTIKGKIRKNSTKNNGYKSIVLHKNGKGENFYIHRLVLQHFGGSEEKETTNHKDGNKSNNHISNLEWMTYTENNRHAIKTGLNISEHKQNNKSSMQVEQRDLKGVLIKTYPSFRQAERETGVDATSIGHGIRKGWKYGGFIWTLPSK